MHTAEVPLLPAMALFVLPHVREQAAAARKQERINRDARYTHGEREQIEQRETSFYKPRNALWMNDVQFLSLQVQGLQSCPRPPTNGNPQRPLNLTGKSHTPLLRLSRQIIRLFRPLQLQSASKTVPKKHLSLIHI